MIKRSVNQLSAASRPRSPGVSLWGVTFSSVFEKRKDDSTMCRVFLSWHNILPCLMPFRVVYGVLENVEWAAWCLNVGSDCCGASLLPMRGGIWVGCEEKRRNFAQKLLWYWADADTMATEPKCKAKAKAKDAVCAFIFRYDLLCPPQSLQQPMSDHVDKWSPHCKISLSLSFFPSFFPLSLIAC